jgi:hypothetical protein
MEVLPAGADAAAAGVCATAHGMTKTIHNKFEMNFMTKPTEDVFERGSSERVEIV